MNPIKLSLLLVSLLFSGTSFANCHNGASFPQWLSAFKQEATRSGIPAHIVNSALHNVSFDPGIIQLDRSQNTTAQTFIQYAANKANPYRLTNGQRKMRENNALFQRIERQYGVPAPVLTAYWALESDFGNVTGNVHTLRALATLAYDCRRAAFFRNELMHALRLIQRGDITPAQMRGAWAGEIGQLQFIPSSYNKHAVDFDGDGRRNLIQSRADALASAASLLRQYGWQARQPWLIEVRVPAQMNWGLAKLGHKRPIAQWRQQGVTYLNGQALTHSGNAALLLPMGRNGPAFLAFPNFDAMMRWNESVTYTTAAAHLAGRFAGATPLRAGNAPVKVLSPAQVKQLQSKLRARGLRITKVDGIIGEETRAAVRVIQQQLRLPVDGYPDQDLFRRL